ncbi:WAT1-related protein At2g37460-like [Hevea brasiliensis]|uniref:WAT1-related protein At2g37460-like n=1 Tax=Hevea brasiliensis TaxID=3981 RepID=UPI0025F7F2F4|nr:WAT1-related protein At2g37460-like [Hevea brasiliensis]
MHTLEKVKITTLHSRPKIAGTIATVAEAMVMTLMRGPPVDLLYHAHENAAGADRGPVSVMAFSPLCMVIVAVMSSIILVEKMYLAVAGLYLVVWRKSKDYNSSPTVDDQMILTKQTTDPGNHEKENFDQQVAQPIQQI